MGNICSNVSKKEIKFKPIIIEDISDDRNRKSQQSLIGNFNNIQQYEFSFKDPSSFRTIRSKFQIVLIEENQFMYIFDGQILKIDQVEKISKIPEFSNNLEQIKYLQQIEDYGSDQQKYFKQVSYWQGQQLNQVGGFYSKDGGKQGLWKETFKNFKIKALVYFFGEYLNNQKIGKWRYIYKNQKMQKQNILEVVVDFTINQAKQLVNGLN
ncbi:unnamed protein product [Paramecium sonneborni]|uniref:Uncharacterized protein n=1 Tax=Paramecium sonneborni TaxID=65129 RepID=A0A8S1LND5_9CILI|nr:unnamed protein product [Paramecium sonneborni]